MRKILLAAAVSLAAGFVFATTYTWTGAGGDNRWSTAANWSSDTPSDPLLYPQEASATAKFAASAEVNVDGIYASKLDFLSALGARIVLRGSGAAASQINSVSSFNKPGKGTTLVLDSVAVSATVKFDINQADSHLVLTNAASVVSTSGLALWNTGVSVELEEGTSFTLAGGGIEMSYDTLLRINNAVCTNKAACTFSGGSTARPEIRFEGKNPRLYNAESHTYFYISAADTPAQLTFVMPRGGFTSAPIAAKYDRSKNFGYNGTNPGYPFEINLLAEDGALSDVSSVTCDLIDWTSTWKTVGIPETMVTVGSLPTSDSGHAVALAPVEEGYTYPTRLTGTVANVLYDKVEIVGDPEDWSTVSPDYGKYEGASKSGQTFSTSAEPFAVGEGVMGRVTGWELYRANASGVYTLEDSDDTTSCTYTHTSGSSTRFVWKFVRRYPLTVAATNAANCDLTVNGESAASGASFWFDLGDEVTLTATPKGGHAFKGWMLGSGVLGTNLTVTLTVGATNHQVLACLEAPEHPIPSDCTVLDYLESNGNQYIDLGLKPAAGQVVDLKLANRSTGNAGMFGCFNGAGVRVGVWNWGNHYLGYNGGSAIYAMAVDRVYRHHIEVATADYPNGAYFVDGQLLYANQATASDYPYFLFAATSPSKYPLPEHKGAMRFYSLKITQGGLTTLMNLVPVRQGTTGRVFDTVSGQFFDNQGTGSFTCGPDSAQPFVVAGDPVECGAVSPAYGTTDPVPYGTETECTAPASAEYGAGTASCTGYQLQTQGVDGAWVAFRSGAERSVTVTQGESPMRLVWSWQVDDDARVAQPTFVASSPSSLTVAAFVGAVGKGGATATLSFLYGLSADALDGEVVVGECTNAGTKSATIAGLAANTAYCVKAVLRNGATVVAESSTLTARSSTAHYAVPLAVKGYLGEGLANFAVPVRISETAIPGFTYANAVDRSHIAVSADDELATPYPFEVERWNPDGESIVWVRVPTLEKDARFYLHWGSGVTAPANVPANVWTDFTGVWHFGEASGTCANSTSVGSTLDALVAGTSSHNLARDGAVGLARQMGIELDRGALKVDGSSALSIGDEFTVSCWVWKDVAQTTEYLISHKGNDNAANGWRLQTTSGSYDKLTVLGSSSTSIAQSIPTTKLSWVHLTVVYDGTTASVYANGALAGSGTVAGVVDLDSNGLGFGMIADNTSTMNLRGAMDECRIRSGAMTAEWIAADYAAQHDADFLECGDILTPGVDFVMVDAEPAQIGEPEGGYGCQFVDGGVVRIRMNSLAVSNEAASARRVCTGWTFVPKSGQTLVGTGTVAEFPYTGTGTLTWQFTNLQYRVSFGTVGRTYVSANGGAAVRSQDVWVTENEPLTLSANVDPGYIFLGWSGDLGSEDGTQTTIAFDNIVGAKDLRALGAVETHHYVQDGLVFQLDGLENAVGRHDSAAATWKDLTGNGFDFTLNSGHGFWTDLGYVLTNRQSAVCALGRDNLKGKIQTCEFIWATDRASDGLIFNPGYMLSGNIGMVLYATSRGEVGVFTSQYDYSRRVALPVETGTTNRFVVTYAYGSSQNTPENVLSWSVNGGSVTANVAAAHWGGEPEPSNNPVLGGRRANYDQGGKGRLLSLRIYERVLTAAELARNASVDNDRFFGIRDGGFSPFRLFVTAEPAEFGLPDPACGEYAVDYGEGRDFAVTPRLFAEDGVTAYPLATNDGVRAQLDRADVTEGGVTTSYETDEVSCTIRSNDTTVAWHFTGLQHRLIVRAQGTGLVSVNDGAWTACATNWFAVGASVTLKTKDDGGATFAGWDGTGSASSETTVTVTLDVPRVVVAKYPVPFSATVHDYFTDGIRLWLDGIYNDGTNRPHRADIMYWSDLSPTGYTVVNTNSATEAWDWTDTAFMKSAKSTSFRPQIGEFYFDWSNFTLEHYADYVPPSGYYGTILYTKIVSTDNSSQIRTLYDNGRYFLYWFGASMWYDNAKIVAGYHAMWRNGKDFRIWQPTTGYKTGENSYTGRNYGPDGYTNLSIGHMLDGEFFLVNAPINAIRLYDRALSDHETRWNRIVDDYRFKGVQPDMTVAETAIAGSPANWGVPNVAYGTTNLMYGGVTQMSILTSLEDDPFDGARVVVDSAIAEGSRGVFRGWRLESGLATVTGATEKADVAFDQPVATFTWLFERQYLILAKVNEGGTVRFGDGAASTSVTNYFAEGSSVTLRAVPNEGSAFLSWSGDTAGLADVSSAEISVPVTQARTLTAIFLNSQHEPVTLTWSGGTSGGWYDPDSWDRGSVPQVGDTVIVSPSVATEIAIDLSTPRLARLVLANGGGKLTTLKMSGWATCLAADSVEIGSGGVVMPSGGFTESEESNRVWLAGTSLTVASGGLIDARGCGYMKGGPCWSSIGGKPHYAQGAVHGGGYVGTAGYGYYPVPYGSAEWPTTPGSSWSDSAAGGGAIRLDFTGSVRIDGTVTADGQPVGYGTGSSGGSVLISCDRISGSGEVLARSRDKAGLVYDSSGKIGQLSGGGGGGRIAVHYAVASQALVTDCTVRFDASSSVCHDPLPVAGYGKWDDNATDAEDNITMMPPGTLWFPDNRFLVADSYRSGGWKFGGQWVSPETVGSLVFDEPLVVDRCCLCLPASCPSLTANAGISLSGYGLYSRRDSGLYLSNTVVTVNGNVEAKGACLELYGGSLTVNGDVNLATNSFVQNKFECRFTGGELAVRAAATNGTQNAYGANLRVTGTVNVSTNSSVYFECEPTDGAVVNAYVRNLTIDLGGKLSSENGGWAGYCGQGAGQMYWPAASHGGRGAPTNASQVAAVYGSLEKPVDPGSGATRRGGGVVLLEVRKVLTLNGVINADASPLIGGQYQSAGAGGSVYVKADQLYGSGSFTAAGGLSDQSSYNYAAGGGGRVAVWVRKGFDNWHGSVSAEGGYKHESSGTTEALTEKTAEDGTAGYYRLSPYGMYIIVR